MPSLCSYERFAWQLTPVAVLQSQEEFSALAKLGVKVSWDGRRVIAPPGVIEEGGFVDLMGATRKRE